MSKKTPESSAQKKPAALREIMLEVVDDETLRKYLTDRLLKNLPTFYQPLKQSIIG